MSIRVMSAVWDTKLADSEKLILLALADWSNDAGECWPSIRQLAEKSSKSERTVQATIKQLVAAGHLSRVERLGHGCTYKVHPRSGCAPAAAAPRSRRTPAAVAPPQPTTPTPAAAAPNTSGTTIPQKAAPSSDVPASKRDPFPCPEGVDPGHWRDFRANRRSKRLKDTPTAYRGLLREIDKFSDENWPPGRIVQHAAERGWGGIFDPRGREARHGNGSGNHGGRDEIGNPMVRAATDDLARRAARGDVDLGR